MARPFSSDAAGDGMAVRVETSKRERERETFKNRDLQGAGRPHNTRVCVIRQKIRSKDACGGSRDTLTMGMSPF